MATPSLRCCTSLPARDDQAELIDALAIGFPQLPHAVVTAAVETAQDGLESIGRPSGDRIELVSTVARFALMELTGEIPADDNIPGVSSSPQRRKGAGHLRLVR